MATRKFTDEQKRLINERRRQTKLERYGDPNYNNMRKNLQTKEERYGDSHYNNTQKHKETCLERYGVEHHNQREEAKANLREKKLSKETQSKYEQTFLERYGVTNINLSPEISAKRISTIRERYGVDSPLQNASIKAKQLQTLKENGSYNKSQIEEDVYNRLLSYYADDDIIRQYSDERYPFSCDFYIKSKDIFIEVNNHPSHGGHPFNPNDAQDVKLLEDLKQKGDKWSESIIDVWANRDVVKFQCAKEHNLDYRVIYNNIDEIVYE